MDDAIVLAAVAGVFWALNIVIVRWAIGRSQVPALAGAFVGVGLAALVAVVIATASGHGPPGGSDLARFGLVGAIAPGSSQGLFVASIGAIGPSRSSVLIGTSPMFSVLLAIVFLDESWQLAIIAGTVLTVLGGALISWEPGEGFRRLGVLFAIATALTFAVRDVTARQFTTETELSSWWAGAVVLGAAALVLAAMLAVQQRRGAVRAVRDSLPHFVPSGLMIGLALPVLLEALDRGQVGVVAPLSNAVQHIAVVVLGAAVFGAGERTPRVLVALVLIVVGGSLIAGA